MGYSMYHHVAILAKACDSTIFCCVFVCVIATLIWGGVYLSIARVTLVVVLVDRCLADLGQVIERAKVEHVGRGRTTSSCRIGYGFA